MSQFFLKYDSIAGVLRLYRSSKKAMKLNRMNQISVVKEWIGKVDIGEYKQLIQKPLQYEYQMREGRAS